jgi:hypothetical protein
MRVEKNERGVNVRSHVSNTLRYYMQLYWIGYGALRIGFASAL